MTNEKNISDSYIFEKGACPIPSLWDSIHRIIIPATCMQIPAIVTMDASLPNICFLKTIDAMYKKAAKPYTKVITDKMFELFMVIPFLIILYVFISNPAETCG